MESTFEPRLAGLAILAALALGGCDIGAASAQGDTPPYWASLRYDATNMRVGPGGDYPVDWEYARKGLPVKVLRKREAWELVEDIDGAQGWISSSQLSRRHTAMVTGKGAIAIREEPHGSAALMWRAEPGVIGTLRECEAGWCEIDIEGRRGWVPADRLWGDEPLPAPE
jgi:SH3-like domain-containing protein